MCKNAMLNQQKQENNIQLQQNAPIQNQQVQNAPQQLERNVVAENLRQNQQQNLQQNQQKENALQNQEMAGFEIVHVRSHIREALENIPGTKDSADMTSVKIGLEVLGTLLEYRYDLTNPQQAEAMFSTLDSIEAKYLDVIDKCDHYIKVKDKTFTYFNKLGA